MSNTALDSTSRPNQFIPDLCPPTWKCLYPYRLLETKRFIKNIVKYDASQVHIIRFKMKSNMSWRLLSSTIKKKVESFWCICSSILLKAKLWGRPHLVFFFLNLMPVAGVENGLPRRPMARWLWLLELLSSAVRDGSWLRCHQPKWPCFPALRTDWGRCHRSIGDLATSLSFNCKKRYGYFFDIAFSPSGAGVATNKQYFSKGTEAGRH